MLRATFVILGVAVDAFGIALAGCGTSPVATQPIEDSAVVDAQGTADGPRDGAGVWKRAFVNYSRALRGFGNLGRKGKSHRLKPMLPVAASSLGQLPSKQI